MEEGGNGGVSRTQNEGVRVEDRMWGVREAKKITGAEETFVFDCTCLAFRFSYQFMNLDFFFFFPEHFKPKVIYRSDIIIICTTM